MEELFWQYGGMRLYGFREFQFPRPVVEFTTIYNNFTKMGGWREDPEVGHKKFHQFRAVHALNLLRTNFGVNPTPGGHHASSLSTLR